jgi:hypothetical protein
MYHTVSKLEFVFALTAAFDQSVYVRENVTHPTELPDNARYFLSADSKSGFGITDDGSGDNELIAVFSLVRGRGSHMVRLAVLNGANYLGCFDGHLTVWYSKLGFEEYARESNWTPGLPDVVWMSV